MRKKEEFPGIMENMLSRVSVPISPLDLPEE
jgi:hypothetical protein